MGVKKSPKIGVSVGVTNRTPAVEIAVRLAVGLGLAVRVRVAVGDNAAMLARARLPRITVAMPAQYRNVMPRKITITAARAAVGRPQKA